MRLDRNARCRMHGALPIQYVLETYLFKPALGRESYLVLAQSSATKYKPICLYDHG